jgi:hypothetical protein
MVMEALPSFFGRDRTQAALYVHNRRLLEKDSIQ